MMVSLVGSHQYRSARAFLLIHLLISKINQFYCCQFGGIACPKPILLLTQNFICDEERIQLSEYSTFKYFRECRQQQYRSVACQKTLVSLFENGYYFGNLKCIWIYTCIQHLVYYQS